VQIVRALIVDDEPAARSRLARLLEELGVEIAGEAPDGVTALALVHERRPDVLFLDVAMPEVDGFDVARHLGDPRPLIIFQTAYAHFAVKAFEHEALDYVVKPVTRDRLARALDRAARRLADSGLSAGWESGSLAVLGKAFGHVPARPERMLVRQGPGHRLVRVDAIERFTAEDGLVYAELTDVRHATDYSIQELEERFRGAFLRVSRADLVSIAHVGTIAGNRDGSATLSLTSGQTVHVSRRRASEVRRALQR
jgi:two-component system LytT family response regulator